MMINKAAANPGIIIKTCAECFGQNLLFEPVAYWDIATQEYTVIQTKTDEMVAYCNDCNETKNVINTKE